MSCSPTSEGISDTRTRVDDPHVVKAIVRHSGKAVLIGPDNRKDGWPGIEKTEAICQLTRQRDPLPKYWRQRRYGYPPEERAEHRSQGG